MDYIKICGLKRREDIRVSIENGANVVGFIYNVPESPRNLEKSKIITLLKEIPKNIITVITFRAKNAREVDTVMNEINTNYYQVHCSFNIQDLNKFSIIQKKKLIIGLKANQSNKEEVINQINLNGNQFFAFLIDNSEGSGKDLNYELISEIQRKTIGKKIIIAGGINIDNIELLIEKLDPYGIDLSSSLESERGVKDHVKIEQFLEKINKFIK